MKEPTLLILRIALFLVLVGFTLKLLAVTGLFWLLVIFLIGFAAGVDYEAHRRKPPPPPPLSAK